MRFYASIDGADNVGKTTIISKLKNHYYYKYINTFTKVQFTKQPGDPESDVCKLIREMVLDTKYEMDSLTNELLFLADLSSNIKYCVEPYNIIITDRGLLTHYAYSYAKRILTPFLGKAFYIASRGILPTITYIIKRSPENIKIDTKNLDRIEKQGIEFQNRVKDY